MALVLRPGWAGIGVVLLIGFVAVEARCGQPLVPLEFLRSRNRSIANMVRICYYVGSPLSSSH